MNIQKAAKKAVFCYTHLDKNVFFGYDAVFVFVLSTHQLQKGELMNQDIEVTALNALRTVIHEHIGTDFETDNTLQEQTTKGHRENQLLISLCGKGELDAQITVNERNDLIEVDVVILNYRRPNHTSWHYPNSHFKVKL